MSCWLQWQPLGTVSAGCALIGSCTARQAWAVMLKTRSVLRNLHNVDLVLVIISTWGEMHWYLASREVSPERNSPMFKWWKCRSLHKSGFKGPLKSSMKKQAGGLEDEPVPSSRHLGWWTNPWKTRVLQQPIASHMRKAFWNSISTMSADRESKGRSWEVTGWQKKIQAFQQWRQNQVLPLEVWGIEVAVKVFVTWKP